MYPTVTIVSNSAYLGVSAQSIGESSQALVSKKVKRGENEKDSTNR
jgi:hypothetical protein